VGPPALRRIDLRPDHLRVSNRTSVRPSFTTAQALCNAQVNNVERITTVLR